jgi:hypothetical protein
VQYRVAPHRHPAPLKLSAPALGGGSSATCPLKSPSGTRAGSL